MFGYDTVPTTEFVPPVIVRSAACGPSRPVWSASVPCQWPTYALGTTAPAGPAEESTTADGPGAVGLAAAEPAAADGFPAEGVPGEPECGTVTAITTAAAAATATAAPAMTAGRRRASGLVVTSVAGCPWPAN